MRRIHVEVKPKRDRDERSPVLTMDPRDADILRAKRLIEHREKRL